MARLIGTAGHVDHGKTTLIRALTGIDADRLPEEKRRGMTIDIGFAYVELPGVGRVSIVDVPGHERFLTNMLVGALGIDVALLCISADESVMQQTREHLQILELLPVEKLIVAMTRADLADDETRLFARAEIEELLDTTRFKGAQVLEVSALKGTGLEELKAALAAALSVETPESVGPWYLAIDRAFAVKGHGCVVTGTLAQGTVKVGDRGFIEPGHHEVRVRAIHSHDETLDSCQRGRRTALNLGGIKLEDVHRGQSVGEPGALFETELMDVRMHWVNKPKYGARVRVSAGAEEVIAKAFHNDQDPDLLQLRLETPLAVAMRQPIIVRRYSPPVVLGGGRVQVPQAKQRRKSETAVTVEASGSDEEAILSAVGDDPGVTTEEICRVLGKTPQTLGKAFEALTADGRLRGFAGLWMTDPVFEVYAAKMLATLRELHEKTPTLATVPRERVIEAAGLKKWAGKPLDRIVSALVTEERLRATGTGIRHPEFSIQLSDRQRQLLDRVLEVLAKEPVNTPSAPEIARVIVVPAQAVEEILRVGQEGGEIVRIEEGIFYTPEQLEALKARVLEVSGGQPFHAAQFRDAIGTTRKYAIPLLEYFDRIRFTTRVGDQRMVNR